MVISQSVNNGPEKYHNNQVIRSAQDHKECLGGNDDSFPKRIQETNSLTLPENHSVKDTQGKSECQVKADEVCRRDEVKSDQNSSKSKGKGYVSPSKRKHVKPGQSSSKDQIGPNTDSSTGRVHSTSSTKDQEGKVDQSSTKGQVKVSPTSNKDQVKAAADSSKGQVKNGRSSNRTLEVKAAQSSGKGQVEDGPASRKDQEVRSCSSSRKDPYIKGAPSSHKDQQTIASSESSREQKTKLYKLPFISTDEQENKDNADPRWKEQAKLSTNEERYKLAHKLWKNPLVPDPNRNLTIFSTRQLKTLHSLSPTGSRKRRRSHCIDEECVQPLRKRQCRFKSVTFSTNHITRSKYLVMNEFQENLALPNISVQAAKKMESSYNEKQYMLDLALEEVQAIQQFYAGLPNQDLTLTQQEVEKGWEAAEHAYKVFGPVYGYNGQEFFP